MARLNALPVGYVLCEWCGHGVKPTAEQSLLGRCPNCGLHTSPGSTKKSASSTRTTGPKKSTVSKSRKTTPRSTLFSEQATGNPILGVDPGARYTGIVIRDGDVVLFAETLVRDIKVLPGEWARIVVAFLKNIQKEWGDLPMGVEGVTDPKGFKGGERAAINPAHIMRAAVVFGAVAAVWEESVIIPPGGNGSLHASHYPPVLKGRRPKELPGNSNGAGTRAHEQSAYDVAGKTIKLINRTPTFPL